MERRYDLEELRGLERFFRAALVNSLRGAGPLVLVGSVSPEGVPNLAPFNSLVHVGANPPLLGLVFRPLTDRVGHTFRHLEATGWCTLNAVHAGIREAAHRCSARFAEGVSEFDAAGLTALTGETHPAPYVAESRVRLGCSLEEVHPIRANGTRFAVLAVRELFLPADAVGPDGFVDPAVTGSLLAVGTDAYGEPGPLTRLPYAHP